MTVQQLAPLILSDDERAELKSLTMRRKTTQALALRARIVLTRAEGGQNTEVAAKLGLDRQTVGKWRRLAARGGAARRAAFQSAAHNCSVPFLPHSVGDRERPTHPRVASVIGAEHYYREPEF